MPVRPLSPGDEPGAPGSLAVRAAATVGARPGPFAEPSGGTARLPPMRMRMFGAVVMTLVLGCGTGAQDSPSGATAVASAALGQVPDGGALAEPALKAVRYSCGGPGFLAEVFGQPATAETEAHPSAEALRAAIAQVGPDIDMLPGAGYRLVHRDDVRADYIAGEPSGAMVSATIEVVDGVWRLQGWGGCRPEIVIDGLSLATWVLDPALPAPDASTTRVSALVTERACTGARPMGGRLQPPRISSTETEVIVVFAAIPLEGDAFDCPGNPTARVEFELSEALGDRRLLDGAFFPPVEPVEAGS